MTNFKDIAKLASVSTTTVSHVVNNTRFVGPETKKHVLDAIKKLNYQPNLLARGLATGKTHTIGLVISDIKNPFYPEIIQGIEEVALKEKYNIFLCNTNYGIKSGLNSINDLMRRKIDGIIIAASQIDSTIIVKLLESAVDFVLIDYESRNIKADSICFDYKKGIQEGVDYLISMGHKNIFFISGPRLLNTATVRERNFIESIEKYKEQNITYSIIESDHKLDGSYKITNKLISAKSLPTAFICSNDLTALGVLKALHEKKINVPNSVSIVGLDNINITEIVTPSLTTINLPRYEIGKTSIEFLLKRIKNKKYPKQQKTFQTNLIIRDSTGRAPNLNI